MSDKPRAWVEWYDGGDHIAEFRISDVERTTRDGSRYVIVRVESKDGKQFAIVMPDGQFRSLAAGLG